MNTSLRERVGAAMRTAYAQQTGENIGMVPWSAAPSRKYWLPIADVAIQLVRDELLREENAAARRN